MPPCGTATPNFASSSFAWYSWMFIGSGGAGRGAHLAGEIDEPPHRLDRFVEFGLLLAVEADLDDALDPAGADYHRHADIEVLDAVLPGQPGGAGQDPLLVAQIGLGHRDRRACRGVEGRAGLQEIDDLGATVAGALDDLIDPFPRGPAHPDQLGKRDAGHRRI